jgi:hypothetical protein
MPDRLVCSNSPLLPSAALKKEGTGAKGFPLTSTVHQMVRGAHEHSISHRFGAIGKVGSIALIERLW